MQLKGIETIREKLPDYPGKKVYFFLVIVILTIAGSMIFQIFFDLISQIFPRNLILQLLEPITPLLGSSIVLTLGLLIVHSIWRKKEKYLEKYKEKAYQKTFIRILIGIPMVISVIFHSIVPLNLIALYSGSSPVKIFLSTAIDELILGPSSNFIILRIFFFVFFLLLFFLVIYRAITVFGMDYMGLVYLYYPDESEVQDSKIYSVLRHPTYHALVLFNFACFSLRFSFYSIAYVFIFIIGINLHLKLTEEKELIQRFGDRYKKYKEETPALFVKFQDIKKYFHFLFGK